MPLLKSTTLSLVIAGDDLHGAIVTISASGVRSRSLPVIRGALSASEIDVQQALSGVPQGASVTLTCPWAWCAIRPMAISAGSWKQVRADIRQSIEDMFPIKEDRALVGFVDRAQAHGDSGYLLALDRAQLDPWIGLIERALGRPVSKVLAPHQAMLGLGLQQDPASSILELTSDGTYVRHRLQYGEIGELAAPYEHGAQDGERIAVVDHGDVPSAERPLGAATIGPVELGVGAALAPRVAPGRFAPLIGEAPRAPRRWALPVAAAVGIGAVLWAASLGEQSRFERAARALADEQDSNAALIEQVTSNRARAVELSNLLSDDITSMTADWSSVMPDLGEARSLVPEGGFLYRVELDEQSLTIRGEAPRASDVLRSIEDSDAFSQARYLSTAVTVEERSLEQFDIRADRVRTASVARGPEGERGGAP